MQSSEKASSITRITRRMMWRAGLSLIVAILTVTPAAGELDHLLGIRIRDPIGNVGTPAIVNSATSLGLRDCEVKQPVFYLDAAQRDGLDDPRGGAVGSFICYKARCPLRAAAIELDDALGGSRVPLPKRVQLLCLPANTHLCGDGDIDPGEVCDRNDPGVCASGCSESCTCLP